MSKGNFPFDNLSIIREKDEFIMKIHKIQVTDATKYGIMRKNKGRKVEKSVYFYWNYGCIINNYDRDRQFLL